MLIFISAVIISCSKDNNEEDVCSTEISFVEDGEPVTLPIGGLGFGTDVLFSLKDPSPFDATKVSRILAIRLQEGLKIFDIVLEVNVVDENSCIPLGTYDIQVTGGNEGLLSFAYIKGFEGYTSIGGDTGILEITKCDFENKQISGRFSCTMSSGFTATGEKVITNGTFENVCWQE